MTSSRKAMVKITKQRSDVAQPYHSSGSRKEIQEERNHDSIKQREQKYTERNEIKEPVFKDEMQQMIPLVHKRSEAALRFPEKTQYSESMLHGENSYANMLLLSNQQKLQYNHGFQQVHMLQTSELQEKKRQSAEREQQKLKLQEKTQKKHELISSSISKSISTASNLQKKQLQMNRAATSREGSTEHVDATQFNGLVYGRHQENPTSDRSSRILNFKIKDSLSRNSNRHSSRRDTESESTKAHIPFAADEKPVQVQTTMKARSAKGHKLEASRKINEVMTKTGANVYNMPRTLMRRSSNLQEKKQTREDKLAISQETEQMKASSDVETQILRPNVSVAGLQSSSEAQPQKEAQQNPTLCCNFEDECQRQSEEQALATKHSNTVPMTTKEQQDQESDFSRDDEHEFKDSVLDLQHRTHEERAGISYIPQPETSIPEMPDPLTESENHLKQILKKNQLFMNTAQALFKLNVPSSILHANSHNYHEQDSKLVLDCGYEVMKRKGRRQEVSVHPFLKVSITSNKAKSWDELVKQMCKDFEKLKLYGRDGREDSPSKTTYQKC
ncbi:myosin-13-like isoform X2 [Hibiscus syriacus]|uniref:myosin-13-like isoform X2 n=1 Tax=Hibiscus syriacus TaxID=106335 RepID=UPI0019230A03|nr:myosin-13-like isoform X2 [Hibiscus syriacus]